MLAWLVLHLLIKERGEEGEEEGKEKMSISDFLKGKFKDTETLGRKGEEGVVSNVTKNEIICTFIFKII